MRGKLLYATKGEHDFAGPAAGFDVRGFANRAAWQRGATTATARIRVSGRIAWHIERHFARYGAVTPVKGTSDVVFVTEYADSRRLVGWVLSLGGYAHITEPPAWTRKALDRHDPSLGT